LLKKSGIPNEILQARNGEVALQVLAGNLQDIGLILLDWQMPLMNGLEFMGGVSKVPATAEIPIVMVTASSSEENKRQALEVNPQTLPAMSSNLTNPTTSCRWSGPS